MKKKFKFIVVQSQFPQMNLSLVQAELEKKGILVESAGVEEFNVNLLENADVLKIPIYNSSKMLKHFPVLTLPVQHLGVFDILIKQDHQFYPRLIIFDAFLELLAKSKVQIDIRKPAYIVGDEALSRVAFGILAHLGFSKIFIYGKNTNSLKSLVKEYQKNNFNLKVEVFQIDEITQNQEVGSMLINTEFLKPGTEELELTSYFNFLSKGALVLDLCNIKELHEEAQRAELQYLSCTDVEKYWNEKVIYWLGFGGKYAN